MTPLQTRKLRDLDVLPTAAAPAPFVYAASGLVSSGGELHVVADDELHLVSFAAAGGAPGTRRPLFAGELPQSAAERKREKPDLEILLRLPSLPLYPHGALLALGSGSRPNRQRGALLALDALGRVQGGSVPIDAAPLYLELARETVALNLEGAWLQGTQLRLVQRGNQGAAGNAIIDVDFTALENALVHEHVLRGITPHRVTELHLGAVDGVRLGFTDACGLPDGRWLFSAVAENTQDSYADGEFAGAVVGMADAEAQILWQRRLQPACKVEGLYGELVGGELRLLCVTDADDRLTPAQLLEARLSI